MAAKDGVHIIYSRLHRKRRGVCVRRWLQMSGSWELVYLRNRYSWTVLNFAVVRARRLGVWMLSDFRSMKNWRIWTARTSKPSTAIKITDSLNFRSNISRILSILQPRKQFIYRFDPWCLSLKRKALNISGVYLRNKINSVAKNQSQLTVKDWWNAQTQALFAKITVVGIRARSGCHLDLDSPRP